MSIFILITAVAVPFVYSIFITPFIRLLAKRLKVTDKPEEPFKKHTSPTPLLGGSAVFLSFAAVLLLFYWFKIGSVQVEPLILAGILFSGFLLVVGGILDDIFKLPPVLQFAWPVMAALVVVLAGIGQDNVTNPLYYLSLSSDPLLHLKQWEVAFHGFKITLWTDLFTFVWLLVLMYATKFLDGLNGLVSGMSVIGGVILLITSITLGQSFSVLIALAMTGAFLGFLPYNFQGKIFLGEGGSTLAGFLLGVLALLGPAKISITLLILGIPILDVLWVVYERIFKNKKSPFKGDLSHLHFKLINFGLNEKQTVVLLWILSLLFGLSGLLIKDSLHGVLLLGLLIVMVFLAQYTRITR